MDPFIPFVAISGWVIAVCVLLAAIRVNARRADEEIQEQRLRFVTREFLRTARTIEDLVTNRRGPHSQEIATADGMMRLAFFDLSLDAPPDITRAASRYRDHVTRYLTDYFENVSEAPDDTAARTESEEQFVRSVAGFFARGELERYPRSSNAALSDR